MFEFSTKNQRKLEEELYEMVVKEIQKGEINKALWAKALSHSGDDEKATQGLYIKYRIQKLKDEISDSQEEERKVKKDEAKLVTLNETVAKTAGTFNIILLACFLLGISAAGIAYLFYSTDGTGLGWAIGSVLFLTLCSYLIYLNQTVLKISDPAEVKKRLNILFGFLIPLSLLGTVIGFIAPLLGVIMFVSFVTLCIKAIKYYNAFNYAKKNNLIE